MSGSVCKSIMFQMLYSSKRLEKALNVICDIKEDDQKYYAFSEDKFLEFVCLRFHKIYLKLEKRYHALSDLPRKKKLPTEIVQIEGKEMNRNISTISAGFVVDELPLEIIPKFLERIGLSK